MVIRTLPKIEAEEETSKRSALERWVTSGVPERMDVAINAFLAKTLRKAKVVVLKIDNFVTLQLKRVVHENSSGRAKPDFKEVVHDKQADAVVSSDGAQGLDKVDGEGL